MPSYFTTDTLIEDVKRRALIPENQSTFSEDDFISFANTELKVGLVPSVLSFHEEYYVTSEEVALEANINNYEIPYRALGGKLRDLFFKNTSGDLLEMSRISPEDKALYQNNTSNTVFGFFYLEGGDVILVPGVSDNPSGSLVFSYFIRPNELVPEDEVAAITAISVGVSTTTYTLDIVPTAFSTSQTFDILQAKSNHKIRDFDLTSTAINSGSKTITFTTTDLPDRVVVGDHIALSGQCIIPQCPTDLQPVLAQRVACRVLESLGDREGLTAANAKLAEMELKTGTIVDNRVEGAPQKLNNTHSLLRSGRSRRRGYF